MPPPESAAQLTKSFPRILRLLRPLIRYISSLTGTCGGTEASRCTWSTAMCPFRMYNVHIQCRIGLSNQFAQPLSYFASQHRLSVFDNPYQVVLQIIDRMRCLSVAHKHNYTVATSIVTHHPVLKMACLKAGNSTLFTDYRQ